MEYAYIQNSDKSIIEYKILPDDWNKADVAHKFGKDREIDILPVERIVEDTDPASTKLGPEVVEVLATKVKITRPAIAKTAEELEHKRRADILADKENLEPLYLTYTTVRLIRAVKLLAKENRTAQEEAQLQDVLSKLR